MVSFLFLKCRLVSWGSYMVCAGAESAEKCAITLWLCLELKTWLSRG